MTTRPRDPAPEAMEPPAVESKEALPSRLSPGQVTVLLVFPIGVCLGVFLPTAIEAMKKESPHLVPWAWGINGVFSVLAPLLAVAGATTFGISALLLTSVPIYLLVAFSFPQTRDEAAALAP